MYSESDAALVLQYQPYFSGSGILLLRVHGRPCERVPLRAADCRLSAWGGELKPVALAVGAAGAEVEAEAMFVWWRQK